MRVALALAAALVLSAAPAAPAAAKYKKCPDGSYVLDSPPVFSTEDPSRFDSIVITGKKVAIRSGCDAVRATFVRTRKGTKIRARWKECQGIANVRLKAAIDPDCLKVAGSLKSKSLGEKAFVGVTEDPPSPTLAEGLAVLADCPAPEPNAALEGIEALCELFGVEPCVSQSAYCTEYRRQLFTGTRLGEPVIPAWNGRGGSGDPMADAVLCTMRQLSPELDGPLVSDADIDLGPVGMIKVRQEVGFNEWDRLAHRLAGYRRVEVTMPILGDAQPITQEFRLDGRVLGATGNSAGSYPIRYGYGVDVKTKAAGRALEFRPPNFTVDTPYGPISVQPFFTYGSNGAVIDSPYGLSDFRDVSALFSPQDTTLRLVDLYGIYPGVANTTVPLIPTQLQAARGAWSSELGLGTRSTLLGDTPWLPPASGPVVRPDELLHEPRSEEEAAPSVYAMAYAEASWPDAEHIYDLLPGWVAHIPFLEPPIAKITVKPSIEAGASSQLFLALEERTDHERSGELGAVSRRRSTMNLKAQANVSGSFSVEAGLRLKVAANIPFVGNKTLIDVEKSIPIPLFGKPFAAGELDEATAISLTDATPDQPEVVDALAKFHDLPLLEGAAVSAFFDACYAPEQPAAQETPVTPPKKGDPTDLFEFALYPCNLCVYTRAGTLESIKIQYLNELPSHPNDPDWIPWDDSIPDDWNEVFLPATTGPSWGCDDPSQSGCYDLCRFDPPSTLVVEKEPAEIIPLLPPTPEYDDERALLSQCQ
jgi:hypothetical protein